MNIQILQELEKISLLLTILVIVIVIFSVISIINNVAIFRMRKNEIQSMNKTSFINEANRYLDSGDFDKLHTIALERTDQFPSGPRAKFGNCSLRQNRHLYVGKA